MTEKPVFVNQPFELPMAEWPDTRPHLQYRCYHLDETGYPAAWGARTILDHGRVDIVPDRVDTFGSDEDKNRLFEYLGEHLPREVLNDKAGYLRGGDDEAHVLLDDDVVKVVASPQASYGYLYITAVLKEPK